MTEWQPLTWTLFHLIGLNYNKEYKTNYIEFFDTFKTIIPCKVCRENYIEHLKKENMILETNINENRIFDWTIDLHNTVNKMNKNRQWSYDESKSYYSVLHLNNINTFNKYLKLFMLEYVKHNFKKNPIRTQGLMRMLRNLPYIYPEKEKRDKLIEFKNKFNINRDNLKQWIISFLIIIKNQK